jgi:hypothetical protein
VTSKKILFARIKVLIKPSWRVPTGRRACLPRGGKEGRGVGSEDEKKGEDA